MEKTYPPNKFGASAQNIPLKTILVNYSKVCNLKNLPNTEHMQNPEKADVVFNLLKIKSERIRANIIDDTNITLLNDHYENVLECCENKINKRIVKPIKISEPALKLETVQVRKHYKDQLLSSCQSKYQCNNFNPSNQETDNSAASKSNDIEVGSEIIVAVRIYHQFEFNYEYTSYRNSYSNLKFSHELIVLGSNTLAELRDQISCYTDHNICTEVKDPTKEVPQIDAKDVYPSGFIFIDNVFYNDMRHPNSIDYSDIIIEWAKDKKLDGFTKNYMDKVKIIDLSPYFGYPYVYQHQGKCEHILVFSDAWVISNNDVLKRDYYPAHSSFHRPYNKYCTICYRLIAKWVCVDSDRLPHSKSFLCKECLISYNYKDGKKLGEFKVYPFISRSHVV